MPPSAGNPPLKLLLLLLLLPLLTSPKSLGCSPLALANRFNTSVRLTTPDSRPEILAPGSPAALIVLPPVLIGDWLKNAVGGKVGVDVAVELEVVGGEVWMAGGREAIEDMGDGGGRWVGGGPAAREGVGGFEWDGDGGVVTHILEVVLARFHVG